MNMQEYSQRLQYLLATNSINIIVGEFNYDPLKVSENRFLNIFTDHVSMVNKPTHISGFLIHHIYIKRTLMEGSFPNVIVESMKIIEKNP